MAAPDTETAWLDGLDPDIRTFAEQLIRLPDGAIHLARFAAILKEKARTRRKAAETVAVAARIMAPHASEVLELTHWAVREQVPAWHFRLVRDEIRNAAYQRALDLAVDRSTVVFEVGTGSGVLAMMAARAGAAHVFTCESSPLVARAAVENVRRNGLADRITVIAKPVAAVTVGKDLPRPADVFVAEIVDNTLLGEHVLPIMEDVKQRMLRPDARVLPGKIMFRGALVGGGHWLATTRMNRQADLDLSAFNVLAPEYAAVDSVDRVVAGEIMGALSDDVTVVEFDLQRDLAWPARRNQLRIQCRRAGRADALLTWLRLEFSGSVAFENRPPQKSCWTPIVYPLGDGIDVRQGQTVVLDVRHDRREIRIGIGRPA